MLRPDRQSKIDLRKSLGRRFLEYQQERFPLAVYAPLTAVFTFSAAAYSRLVRGEPGFIGWGLFAVGAFTALVFFFVLRVLDEHKDAETDRRWRPDLPVPRGVISLAELRGIAVGAVAAALVLNTLVAPVMLLPCLLVAGFAALMTKEFFVGEWLRARPAAYLVSHMAIMPLIDGYTTGLDWLAAGKPPGGVGLWLFLVATFLNGTVLEIGRKIRAPEDEREGVDTYSRGWGVRAAPAVRLGVLLAAAVTIWLAAGHVGGRGVTTGVIAVLFVAAAVPGVLFLQGPGRRRAKLVETASGLWLLSTYLLLGLGPFLWRILGP